ncbi:hypothetical protein APX01_07175 [Cereibacter sphaeroides]|uniref:hypothetical protein n=1 Tax=Cereibacter sphaeroides TaxID=1063 RepID=UPI00076F72CF|nr:hypothetical protein [Cereibacter sphaeroides]AMJ47317.1 hypothetical protein APX01_07175 [Cereibacter sphaeroides]
MPSDHRSASLQGGARQGAAAICALIGLSAGAAAQEPLSAIDWLSRSVAAPVKLAAPPEEPKVTKGALPAEVAVTPLDGPSPDAAGILPASRTGLPHALWGMGRTTEIANRIAIAPTATLPALQSLLTTMLLAEAEPPADSEGKGRLLLARVDKLLAMGALEGAKSLIDAAGDEGPEIFRRKFDIALLTGEEDASCVELQKSPDLAPTLPARIFCLARSGDWNAAALTLRTAQALGFVDDAQDALLSRFLDPDLYEGEGPLTPPARVTPLDWRLLEAVGEPLPTQSLPIAFAHAELRDTAGWKAQIEAAERLSRAGALDPNLLVGLYTARKAAASGGVWDRVRAFQALDEALTAKDAAAVARTLPVAYDRMSEVELEVTLSRLVADRLDGMTLPAEAEALAFRMGLLSMEAEAVAKAHKPRDAAERFLVALAAGDPAKADPADPMGRAIAAGFGKAAPFEAVKELLAQDRPGEALLLALEEVARGMDGDTTGVTQGLALFRELGLQKIARRTALELMLLERRG